jgi:hypothetical protein
MMGESTERTIGRMDANITQLLEIVQNDAESRKEIYKRLNSLERWRSGIVAAGATVTTIFGLIMGLLQFKVGK